MTTNKQVQKLFEAITWPYNSIHNAILIEFDEDEQEKSMLQTLESIKERLDDLNSACYNLEIFLDKKITQLENEVS
jgi:hypothetical protein